MNDAYAFIAGGLLLLLLGSETVVRGAVGLSKSLGFSPLLIGLLVVSLGTSAPELVVSLQAAFKQVPDLALGNIVGSNIVNILLILGFGALIRPLPSSPRVVLRDGGAMLLASIALFVMMQIGTITRQEGWILLCGFVLYVVISFLTDWRRPTVLSVSETRAQARMKTDLPLAVNALLLIFGLGCLYFGAYFVVDGGVVIARAYHVPQAVIGLTLIALGASLPELMTTIVAATRGHTSIAIGHLIGSSIFNILLVLGLTASIRPLSVNHLLASQDIYVMLGAVILLLPMLASGWRLTRGQGALLVIFYLAYIVFLAWRQGLLSPHLLGFS